MALGSKLLALLTKMDEFTWRKYCVKCVRGARVNCIRKLRKRNHVNHCNTMYTYNKMVIIIIITTDVQLKAKVLWLHSIRAKNTPRPNMANEFIWNIFFPPFIFFFIFCLFFCFSLINKLFIYKFRGAVSRCNH